MTINFITCNRTQNPVELSEVLSYPFSNGTEDLFFFETTLNSSQAAKNEALALFHSKNIPFNFSNDKELEKLVRKYLNTNVIDLKDFKQLSVLKNNQLEYDEAVLLSILWF